MAARKGELRRRVRTALVPALLLAVALYLGYHTIQGDRGLLAWKRLTSQVESLRGEVAVVRGERERLEQRVRRLRPETLDSDLLEERARAVLSLGHPDERIILEDGGR